MGERQFGPYRLVRQIAVGGMAEIHLAKTKGIAGFEKYVALKMIHPNFAEDEQFIQMLVDEAKIAVQLTHGNIAQTFDLGRVGETYYITMEYVDGADLYKILRRGSEQDLDMPLDVCAFIAKEVTSALDHAHRKRDNFGKNLGIVHRDVSPQNVLVSYAGEVKLVDFGIAKATMKARQTAVGVIKGKYYYMSPEQARGDKLDHRSDIFSAGIVLYEMITGQMLYLEEDLHRLLDMARRADIAPPTTLRKGVPPQLERIVMHALAKNPEDRYQSAGDFATDLERFLHAYSPVFTAGKVAGLIRKVIGDPAEVVAGQDFPSIEVHDGANATMTLTSADLLKTRDELRDENSVIFRVDELVPRADGPPERPTAPLKPAPRTTRAADPLPLPARPPARDTKIPSIRGPALASPKPKPARPRGLDEETRELGAAPAGPNDDGSGLLTPAGQKVSAAAWDGNDTLDTGLNTDDMSTAGEHTMISAAPSGGGFMMDVAGDEGVDATVVTAMPPRPDDAAPAAPAAPDAEPTRDHDPIEDLDDDDDDDGPTMTHDSFTFKPRPARGGRAQPPAALAAKIHAPAVSALRQPRTSRRTPSGGVPQPNVLQQIVGSQASAPMPTPVPMARPAEPTHHAEPPRPPQPYGAAPAYAADASGMPIGLHTPPQGIAPQAAPGVPPHLQPYVHAQGLPPQYPGQAYPGYPGAAAGPGAPPVSPQALYQFSPYGAPPPQPMSLTGQLRLFEADELPSQYKLGVPPRRWIMFALAAIGAVALAAVATFLIVRATRGDGAPTVGAVAIQSSPAGADIVFDGQRLGAKTPHTITNLPVGSQHELRVELARHTAYVDTITIPQTGAEVPVMALLKEVTGKVRVLSRPDRAEVWIDGKLYGVTPRVIEDLRIAPGMKLELRLKDHQPHIQTLSWPENGQIDLDIKLER